MQKTLALLAMTAALGVSSAVVAQEPVKPTIVLVHGAFADASSWNGVITQLNKDGYRTIATANALRGVAVDAAPVTALLKAIEGDVVVVAHSYGGMVVAQAADGQTNVKALVYVDAFMPEVGEDAGHLAAQFPGSVLNDTLWPVALSDGNADLYIQPDKFHAAFAADVSAETAMLMAATQRPGAAAGLFEPATAAAWKTIPTFSIWGSEDLIIPAALHAFQAERAGVVKAVEIAGGSHAVMVSHPAEVAALIEEAATQGERID